MALKIVFLRSHNWSRLTLYYWSTIIQAQYDWTTGVPDNGNDWRWFHVVPRSHSLRLLVFVLCFLGGGNRRAFRPPGEGGITSIVRWNLLHLVIFGYIRCWYYRRQGKGVHSRGPWQLKIFNPPPLISELWFPVSRSPTNPWSSFPCLCSLVNQALCGRRGGKGLGCMGARGVCSGTEGVCVWKGLHVLVGGRGGECLPREATRLGQ